MEAADAIALYGAALASVLAVSQGASAWRQRTRIEVRAHFEYEVHNTSGTPVLVERGDDTRMERVAVRFTIRNLGGKPVQVSGVLIESLDSSKMTLHTHRITPMGIPIVLDPGTEAETVIQKEQIDLLDSCTFLGIVDGTGRRHGVPSDQAAEIVKQSWSLPTRVGVFQRRDDPAKRVVAFRATDPARLTTRVAVRSLWRRPAKLIAARPRTVLETLLDGGSLE
ncbi:hypothetical protein ACFWQC_13605 [Nocardioides sp. NPDC058538]|uniref:hypothetical protein n=1 Tax=Nocardioides sp. NPDC058538 TaxID=3346542 RepID=UPI00365A0148